MKCELLTNRDDNAFTHTLELRVRHLISDAERLYGSPFPPITVIITHDSPEAYGMALLEGGIIWISERVVMSRAVVYHELLHALFGLDHVKGCPLLDSHIDPDLDRDICDTLFIQYTENWRLEDHVA